MKSATIDNSPGVLDFTGNPAGYDFTANIAFTDTDGVAITITADTFSLTVLENDGTTFDTYTIGDGLEFSGLSTLVLTIPAATTATMSGSYRYYLDWTPDGGVKSKILIGCIKITG